MLAVASLALALSTGVLQLTAPQHRAVGQGAISIEPIRALYLTSGVAQSSRFDHFLNLLSSTNVNALVIDLKDPDGRLAFRPVTDPIRKFTPRRTTMKDLPKRIAAIHAHGGFAIARIAVFQDTWFAEQFPSEALKDSGDKLWRDRIGYAWLDPSSSRVAQYAIDLAHEAARLGFDEVNFDYVRFASDGALQKIRYPYWDGTTEKTEVIRRFAHAIDEGVRQHGIRTSADVFGLSLYAVDGMGIGQHLETLAPYFDVLSPMVYPSHYANGFQGFANPAEHPYEVIAATLKKGMMRLEALPVEKRPVIRPWLQDFDLGAPYGSHEIAEQQRAGVEFGAPGWMLWNPIGRYTEEAFTRTE